jgi:hypothetical protein
MRYGLLVLILLAFPIVAISQPLQWAAAEGGNDHYYQAVLSDVVGLDWEQARDYAEAMGGHLATVTSAAENEWIWLHLDTPEQQFLGGIRSGASWVWITGEAWSFTAWAAGEPNNSNGGEPYLEYAHNMDWNDVGNLDLGVQGFVVEWDSGAVPSEVVNWGTMKTRYR